MWVAAAIVTMICFGINNTLLKWGTMKHLSKIHIQLYFYSVAFIVTLIFGLFTGIENLNFITICIGALIGILNANGNIQMSKAFEKGPASLTSPLVSSNAVIPILSAALIFHEHISLIQWIGIMVMLGSAIVIQYSPSSNLQIDYIPWLLRILFAVLSFGILGILMKTSTYLHITPINLLISMYGGGTLYLIITSLIVKENWQKTEVKVGSLVGLISIIGYGCYFFALNTGIASIVFPIVSLSCLIVVLVGCWLFKERIRNYQLMAIFTAIIGIIMTKL